MKLVDSSAWVEFLRRKGDATIKHIVARLLEADQAAFTCPIRFELMSGVKAGEEKDLEQAFALSHHFPFCILISGEHFAPVPASVPAYQRFPTRG